jgi:glycosyltransferase involved in cell wall biosynthesis
VAVARNTAIEASRGTYVAPIDADDLWHPERVERHVRALETAGEDTAVAYSPFYVIDKESNVLGKSRNYDLSGEVFSAHLKYNPVGNGSGMLVRKEALQKVGGNSSLLLERGAQGCEDYLVQLELAYSYKVTIPRQSRGLSMVSRSKRLMGRVANAAQRVSAT